MKAAKKVAVRHENLPHVEYPTELHIIKLLKTSLLIATTIVRYSRVGLFKVELINVENMFTSESLSQHASAYK